MSDPISALNGVTDAGGIAAITEVGPVGMITLRGDLSLPKLQTLVVKTTGAKFPQQRTVERHGDSGIAWMSPDELLVMCPYGEVTDTVARMSTALEGAHALVANVSDARAVFQAGSQAVSQAGLLAGAWQPARLE